MRYISELREGDMLSEVYLCKYKQTATTKAGKNYYSLVLQDKTGTIDAKIWELNSGIDSFDEFDYIRIEAQVTCFQNTNQLNIKRVRRAQEGEYIPKEYVPVSSKDIEEMYKQLMGFIQQIKEPHLRKLVDSFFVEDKTFIKRFKEHSAAKSVHHNFMGGLLEHNLNVISLCDFYAKQYPIINKDLLFTASLFHDIGKLEELSGFPENDYTDSGQLLGHIVIGVELIQEKIREIHGFPKKLANQLKHCILAHHGELEYGSPKKPAIIEAMALNFADNTDAKLQSVSDLIGGSEEKGDWIGYQKLYETNIRKTIY